MTEALGELALLARELRVRPAGGSAGTLIADVADRLVLVIATNRDDRERTISMHGAAHFSRSAVAGRYAAVLSRAGVIGVDMETIERIALNTTAHDTWLAPAERLLAERSGDASAEMACHWVLKEAYGKALRVGLDLPLDRLAFGERGGAIRLDADAAPDPTGWHFGLHRHGDLLFGIAQRLNGDAIRAGRQESADAAAR